MSVTSHPEHPPAIHRIVGKSRSGAFENPPLSIKATFGGECDYWTTDRHHRRIDDQSYLVIEPG